MAKVVQLHERRIARTKLRVRAEKADERVRQVRISMRAQWDVEEGKYRAKIDYLTELVKTLTDQIVILSNKATDIDVGGIIKEVGTLLVRVTQGEYTQVAEGQNVADLMAKISGEEVAETAGDKLFVPDHELEILEWANEAMPTRGGFYTQEKEAGAND